MSAIINTAENLTFNKITSIAQTKSQGGRRSSQRRGPTLYNLTVMVGVRSIGSDVQKLIEDEIIDLEYGAKTFNLANIDGQLHESITGVRGNWSGASVSSVIGNQVVLNNLVGVPEKQDFFQITGSTKVYQVSSWDQNSSTITSNSPIIPTTTSPLSITIGAAVEFNFSLASVPSSTYLPGNLVEYGEFIFEEVIE